MAAISRMSDPSASRMLTLQRKPKPTPRPTITVRTAPPDAIPSVVVAPASVKATKKGKKKGKKKALELKFHSGATSGSDGRYLSTTASLPAPLTFEGDSYPTMEHAFYAAKINPKYIPGLTPGEAKEQRKKLQVGGDIELAKDVKGNFKKLKLSLDQAAWNEDRSSVMQDIADARTIVDERFAKILKDAVATSTELKHYEHGKADKVFWGGDRNTLGRIYQEVGRGLIDEGQALQTVIPDPPVSEESSDAMPLPPIDFTAFRTKVSTAHTVRASKKAPLDTPQSIVKAEPKPLRAARKAPKGTVSHVSPTATNVISYDEAMRIVIGKKRLGERLPIRELPQMRAPAYYLNNRQTFVSFITTLLSPYRQQLEAEAENVSCDKKSGSDFGLMTHQAIVRDYMNLFTPYRGLLVYHGLGAGKTCTSIAIAEGMKEQKIVTIMTPASLRVNYVEELKHCGDKLFQKNQHWEFIACSKDSDICNALGAALSLSQDTIAKSGGAWLTDPSKPANIDTLSPEQMNSLDTQITNMIQAKYRFINYNGINRRHYDEMSQNGQQNPFDGQVVIVDEIHNLVSRIVNKLGDSESLAMRIYNDLMRAKDCRLVFLSGTPIVNYPNEMAILFNMLRGIINVYELPVTPTGRGKLGLSEMQKILSNVETIDVVDYRPATRTLVIQRNPYGFVTVERRRQRIGVTTNAKGRVSDSEVLKQVQRELRKSGIQADWQVGIDAYASEHKALPETMEAFSALFVDPVTGSTRNQSILKRRIVGLASYFRSPSEALMPRYNPDKDYHVHKIPMSDYQFGLYEDERAIERKQEGSSKIPKKGGVYKEATSTYRIFSRAFCNFVFPAKIARPKPSDQDIGSIIDDTTPVLEEDIATASALAVAEAASSTPTAAEGEERTVLADTNYNQRIEDALSELEENAAEYLSPEGLGTTSPKFARILSEIQKYPKSCQLLYSQFRTIEGIGVLRLVLIANGFAEFKLGKDASGQWRVATPREEYEKPMFVLYTGTETAEEKEIIRNAFNSAWDKVPPAVAAVLRELAPNNIYGQAIRLFMITASGAEGITTYNVRHVHLVEPYWHPVRTEQVIGRAMRICSHQALPQAERTVSVNLYLMTFSEKQRQEATKEMIQSDKSKYNPAMIVSSDESLHEISEIKAKINSELLKAIKEAAIDCALYADTMSKEGLSCLAFPDATPKSLSYVPSVSQEDTATVEASNKRNVTWGAREVTIDGVKYALRTGTKKLYDIKSYMAAVKAGDEGRRIDPVFVGILHESKAGKVKIKKPWEV